MRVVVGSETSKDFRQAELDRHLEAMSRFIERAGREPNASLCCTMVLRSGASAPAQALILMKDGLLGARVRANAILAKLEPEDALKDLFATLSALSADAPETALIRWARNPRLLDAHEQVTYGDDMCWSGDAMRRDPSNAQSTGSVRHRCTRGRAPRPTCVQGVVGSVRPRAPASSRGRSREAVRRL